ncbi:hypothetical protein K501DRAFT_333857 [Backusella circina FSU 941]|nr:hypothetical protein K501DRAFT_333857 [Backusella circina FSU 941]
MAHLLPSTKNLPIEQENQLHCYTLHSSYKLCLDPGNSKSLGNEFSKTINSEEQVSVTTEFYNGLRNGYSFKTTNGGNLIKQSENCVKLEVKCAPGSDATSLTKKPEKKTALPLLLCQPCNETDQAEFNPPTQKGYPFIKILVHPDRGSLYGARG